MHRFSRRSARGVCNPSWVRLESSINLLVATLDLKLVQLLRGAMHAADAQGQTPSGHLPGLAPTLEPRRHFHPEPVIEPRRHFRPEPVVDHRPVLQRSESSRDTLPACCWAATGVTTVEPKSPSSPIEPPWKVLPWENPPAVLPRPVHKVKLVIGSPDMFSKGNVIDLFI